MRAIADPSQPESVIAKNAFDRISEMCAQLGLKPAIVEIGHQVRRRRWRGPGQGLRQAVRACGLWACSLDAPACPHLRLPASLLQQAAEILLMMRPPAEAPSDFQVRGVALGGSRVGALWSRPFASPPG